MTADLKREKGRRERRRSGAVYTEPSFGERMRMEEREGKKRKGPAATTFSLLVTKASAELQRCRQELCWRTRVELSGCGNGAVAAAACCRCLL